MSQKVIFNLQKLLTPGFQEVASFAEIQQDWPKHFQKQHWILQKLMIQEQQELGQQLQVQRQQEHCMLEH